MKTEYTQPNTLKDAKASLKESRNPKTDQTQAEALKGVKPSETLMKESPKQGVNPDRNPKRSKPRPKP